MVEEWATQSETIGGSSDTEVKEVAARPTGAPSTRAAIATTPVGKVENTRRGSRGSSA